MVFICLMMPVFAQQNFRLYMEAGKTELTGDGDDYTTLVITARDAEGEIIQDMNGNVAVRISAGLIEAADLKMQNGVAMVKYTAPILGQPVKASQRIMLLLIKIIQKIIGMASGSTDMEEHKKIATGAYAEAIKEGQNPYVLTVKDETKAFAYFVCEMNGVKGKTKIHILKATTGANVSIIQGSYHGYDITGQAEFSLEVSRGGFGRMKQGGTEANTILFTSEPATEFNNAMVKMLGGGGFMNAYLGLGANELKYLPDYNIKTMGIGTYYLPMPDNGIFLYVPAILFEFVGRNSLSNATGNQNSTPNSPASSINKGSDAGSSDNNSSTWMKVVGGAAALSAAGATAARLLRLKRKNSPPANNKSKSKKEQEKEKKKKEYVYMLQLNKDSIDLRDKKSDRLVVTVWRVDETGARTHAENAYITVENPSSALSVSPGSGQGQCVATVSQDFASSEKNITLTIRAVADGQEFSASVSVALSVELTLISDSETPQTFVSGKKHFEVNFEKSSPEDDGKWIFKPVYCWFTEDPSQEERSKPSEPPFSPVFTFKATPDILQFDTPADQGNFVWKTGIGLKPGADLDDKWLLDDGKINIDITVQNQGAGKMAINGRSDQTVIRYIMNPPFSVYAEIIERESPYNGLELADDELIADTCDEVKFRAFVIRSDKENGTMYEGSVITHAEMVLDDAYGTPDHDYEVVTEEGSRPGKLGKFADPQSTLTAGISSLKTLLYTKANNRNVKLVLRGEVKSVDGTKKFVREAVLFVRPRFVKLYMRVLPGYQRHTSEVWAGIRIFPKTDNEQDWKLSNFSLTCELEESNGFGAMDGQTPSQQQFRNNSVLMWRILLQGITWENIHLSDFRIKVGFTEQSGNIGYALAYSFNVGRNMCDFLRDFDAAAPSLNLTNPERDYLLGDPLTLATVAPGLLIGMQLIPEYKGVLYDVKSMLGGSRTYTCGELCTRIFKWSARRKFGSSWNPDSYDPSEIDLAQTMNGIEIASYAIAPIHAFFAFWPSGNDTGARFIDPWWYQAYDDHCLLDWPAQIARLAKVLSPLLAVSGTYVFAAALGTTLVAAKAVLVSYLTMGFGLTVVVLDINAISKIFCKGYLFYLGDSKEIYMTIKKNCYDAYTDGYGKINWGNKILVSGVLDEDTYTDPQQNIKF